MELPQKAFSALEVLSDSSKSFFARANDYLQLPSTIYFDSLLPTPQLPSTVQWRILCSLIFLNTEGTKLVESAYQDNQALKSFDESGETVFFIYFSHESSLQSFVLARFELYELCLEIQPFVSELRHLTQNRVKDIKFKSALKDTFGSYKTYFDQWVETVNSQQREIQKLSQDLAEIREKEEKQPEVQAGLISECVICEKERRNVVFVPCGHVAVCTLCLNSKMKIKPNSENTPKKPQQKCVLCKRCIKTAHEVYF